MTADQLGLFTEPEHAQPVPDPLAGLSPGRRRTLRQAQQIEAGWHPLMGDRTRPDLGHCGTCAHRILIGWHDRTWPKCELGPVTHGAGTDCRAWWPGCDRWEAKP